MKKILLILLVIGFISCEDKSEMVTDSEPCGGFGTITDEDMEMINCEYDSSFYEKFKIIDYKLGKKKSLLYLYNNKLIN